jgi:hypothetical protein
MTRLLHGYVLKTCKFKSNHLNHTFCSHYRRLRSIWSPMVSSLPLSFFFFPGSPASTDPCSLISFSGTDAGEVEYKPLRGGPSNSPQKETKELEVRILCLLKSASKSPQN